MNCLKCNFDVSDLMTYDKIGDTIICPNCNNPMIVRYDETWIEDINEEYIDWWLEQVDD